MKIKDYFPPLKEDIKRKGKKPIMKIFLSKDSTKPFEPGRIRNFRAFNVKFNEICIISDKQKTW